MEPEGTVEIKYRFKDLQQTIHRCDAVANRIVKQLRSLDPASDAAECKKLQGELKKREEHLLPIYHTVAVQFADLHDTAGRMLAKNVISVSNSNGLRRSKAFQMGLYRLENCSLANSKKYVFLAATTTIGRGTFA